MQCRRPGFDPWVKKTPWRRKWQSVPVSLPREFHGYVRGACNFLGSVLWQQKFEVTDGLVLQFCVTAQFYLTSRGKYILVARGWADPKDVKRRETPGSILAPLFICFFLLALSLPCVNWASQEGCLFVPNPIFRPSIVLFLRPFSFLCLLATTIMDSFFLF